MHRNCSTSSVYRERLMKRYKEKGVKIETEGERVKLTKSPFGTLQRRGTESRETAAACRPKTAGRNSSDESAPAARLVSLLPSDSRARKKLTYSKRESRLTSERRHHVVIGCTPCPRAVSV